VANSLQLCIFTTKYGIETPVDIPDDLPKFLGQSQQVEQVLINLINNATHAIQEHSQEGTITITARLVDDKIVLTVDDSGPGIPPDKLDTIWEAFYTSKGEKGTGLGLSISSGIIKDHGGTITAVNRPEGGARFTITLPAYRP
jgi:signal transduction histidine kinase